MRSRQCDDGFTVGDVDFGGFDSEAVRFDLGDGVLQAVHVDIGYHHVGAILRQSDAGRPAKPAAATDYDDLAVVEPEQGRVVGHVDGAAVPRRIWIKEESSARP